MLKLYYARQSAYARPVWLALLEKQLPVELIPVNLGGQQFAADFLAVNPFSRVPVLIDGDVRVIESLAILDYLEAKYPDPPLLPKQPTALATVRMVQLITLNELLPAVFKLLIAQPSTLSPDLTYAHLRAIHTLKFLDSLLDSAPFFAGEQLTLADIVAGTLVYRMPKLGVELNDYPKLQAWSDRLIGRPTWQAIELSDEEWLRFRRQMRVIPKVWDRRRRRMTSLPL